MRSKYSLLEKYYDNFLEKKSDNKTRGESNNI